MQSGVWWGKWWRVAETAAPIISAYKYRVRSRTPAAMSGVRDYRYGSVRSTRTLDQLLLPQAHLEPPGYGRRCGVLMQ